MRHHSQAQGHGNNALPVYRSSLQMAGAVGTPPWLGIGGELTPDASIDVWIKQAGLDYELLETEVLFYPTIQAMADRGPYIYPGRKVLLRSDSLKPLSIVSDKYKIFQPRNVLEFFRDIVGSLGYTISGAGSMFDGARYWALAKAAKSGEITPDDLVDSYLLVCSSCDGSLATRFQFVTVRLVCWNMLNMMLSSNDKGVTITHANTVDTNSVKQSLALLDDRASHFFDTIIAGYREVSRKPARSAIVARSTCELFYPEFASLNNDEQHKIARSDRVRRVVQLTETCDGMGGKLHSAAGTAWGWVNAVTQYVDHEARATTPSHKLNSAWFGSGNNVKTRALEMALEPDRFTYSDVVTTRDALLLDTILQ